MESRVEATERNLAAIEGLVEMSKEREQDWKINVAQEEMLKLKID